MLKVFLCVNIYIFICVYECFYLCSTFCWCVNVLFTMPVYFVFCSSLSLNSQNIYIQLNSWMFVNLEYKAQAKTSRVLVEQFGREISLELFWPKFFFQLPVSNRRKSSIFKKVMSMVNLCYSENWWTDWPLHICFTWVGIKKF